MPECQGRPHIWQTTELEREVELRSMALVVRCSECSVGHLLEVLPASDRPEEEDRIRTYLRVFPASGETERESPWRMRVRLASRLARRSMRCAKSRS